MLRTSTIVAQYPSSHLDPLSVTTKLTTLITTPDKLAESTYNYAHIGNDTKLLQQKVERKGNYSRQGNA